MVASKILNPKFKGASGDVTGALGLSPSAIVYNPVTGQSSGCCPSSDSTTLSNELAILGLTNTASMGQSQNALSSLLVSSLGAPNLGLNSLSGLSMSSLSGVSSTASSPFTGLDSTSLSGLGMLSPASLDSSLLASAMTGATSTGSGLPVSGDQNISTSFQSDPLYYFTANLGQSSGPEGWLAEQASSLPSDQTTVVDNLISGARQTLQTDETQAQSNDLSSSSASALGSQIGNIQTVINALKAANGNQSVGQVLTASNDPGPSTAPFLNGGSQFLGGGFSTPPTPSPIQPLSA